MAAVVLSLFVIAGATALAEGSSIAQGVTSGSSYEGTLELNKWVEEADDGSFNLMLESYATGSNGTVTQEPVPVDVVLVLDESGSMDDTLIEGCNNKNGTDVDVTAEGNLLASNDWFPAGDRGQQLFVGHKVFAGGLDTSKTYRIVYPDASGLNDATREIHYCSECEGWFTDPSHENYKDERLARWVPFASEGEEVSGKHTASKWEYRVQFYEECGQTGRDVLKSALHDFLADLRESSNSEDETIIDNRVAIVGYGQGASYINIDGKRSLVYPDSGDAPGGDPVNGAAALAENAWSNASDLTDEEIDGLVSGVRANGSTPTHLGIGAAKLAFENAPETDDANRSKVMILFTDGAPGAGYVNYGPGSQKDNPDWFTPGIQAAKSMKDDGVTIYSVGLFPSADGYDAENINYDVNADGRGTDGFFQNANCFLHLVSSNYPEAASLDSKGDLSEQYVEGEKSYYLGTSDAESLGEIFDQISKDITPGETTVKLDGSSVLKDIVADDFQIVGNGEEITAWTESYRGGDAASSDAWSKDQESESTIGDEDAPLHITMDGKTVNVTNFDYSTNFIHMVGNEAQGKKLVVKIPIERSSTTPGGTNLPTNTTDSGVYENGGSSTAVKNFPVPHIDLPTTIRVGKVVKNNEVGASTQKFEFSVSGIQVNRDDVEYENVTDGLSKGESNYLQLKTKDYKETFSLGDGEERVLEDIIPGTTLTISEQDVKGYVPVVTVGDSSTALEPDKQGDYAINVVPGMIVTFTNVYTPEEVTTGTDAKTGIQVTKAVTGHDAIEPFTFSLNLAAGQDASHVFEGSGDQKTAFNGMTLTTSDAIKAGATETGAFGTITFTAAGNYAFVIDEITEKTDAGWKYDTSTHEVTVHVADQYGKLAITGIDGNNPTFTNKYDHGTVTLSGDSALKVQKTVTGAPTDVDFTFAATFDADASVKADNPGTIAGIQGAAEGQGFALNATVSDDFAEGDAAKMASFDDVTFTQPGTYVFDVVETNQAPAEGSGWTYDGTTKTITVTVTDNGNGALEATADYNNNVEGAADADKTCTTAVAFTNTYTDGGGGGEPEPTPEPTPEPSDPSAPEVDKTLSGRDMTNGEFSFVVTATGDNADRVTPGSITGTSDANGNVTFDGGFAFTEKGDYTFTVAEVLPADDDPDTPGVQNDGVTYDESTHAVTAHVINQDGKLVVAWEGDGVTFANSYEPEETPVPDEPTPEPGEPSTPEQPAPEEPPVTDEPSAPAIPDTGDASNTTAPVSLVVAGTGLAVAGSVALRRRNG